MSAAIWRAHRLFLPFLLRVRVRVHKSGAVRPEMGRVDRFDRDRGSETRMPGG